MGLLSWVKKTTLGVDCVRLETMMDYSDPQRAWGTPGVFGCAAVRWTRLNADKWPEEMYPMFRTVLAVLLYTRILNIDKESRRELFHRIDEVAERYLGGEGEAEFTFRPWGLQMHDRLGLLKDACIPLWPWRVVTASEIESRRAAAAVGNPRVYRSTLYVGAGGQFSIDLNMQLGMDRVMGPASALLAISTLSAELDGDGRVRLAFLLWQINRYYGSPDGVRLGSEAKALAAALEGCRRVVQDGTSVLPSSGPTHQASPRVIVQLSEVKLNCDIHPAAPAAFPTLIGSLLGGAVIIRHFLKGSNTEVGERSFYLLPSSMVYQEACATVLSAMKEQRVIAVAEVMASADQGQALPRSATVILEPLDGAFHAVLMRDRGRERSPAVLRKLSEIAGWQPLEAVEIDTEVRRLAAQIISAMTIQG